MATTTRLLGFIVALALLITTLPLAFAAGVMGITAVWTDGSSDLTIDMSETATARFTFLSTHDFEYVVTVYDQTPGGPGGTIGGTDGSFDTPPYTRTLYVDFPADIAIPMDRHGDYRVGVQAFNENGGSDSRSIYLHVRGNRAPQISVPASSYTVIEGHEVQFDVTGTDADNDILTLTISQGQPSGSTFRTVTNTNGRIVKHFSWTPDYNDADSRSNPYQLTFRTTDSQVEC